MEDLYQEKVYIKDGALMLRESKEVFQLISNISKENLYEIIENFLLNNPNVLHTREIIFSAIKIATGKRSCIHCKTPSPNPNVKILLDDPLYADLLNFVQTSETYKKNFEIDKIKKQKKKERQLSAKIYKSREHALDEFYIGQCRKNKKK